MRDRTTPIPYWVERVASEFRKFQRGDVAPEESIEEARRLMDYNTDQRVAHGVQKRRKVDRRVQP